MILAWLLIITVGGGIVAWVAGWWRAAASRWVALLSLVLDLALLIFIWVSCSATRGEARIADFGLRSADSSNGTNPQSAIDNPQWVSREPPWLVQLDAPWIAPLGIRFHLGMDGLSLLLLTLTAFLGLAAVGSSWTEIRDHVPAFYLTLLWTLAGTMGVFMALDLFLFYFFWELMLVPMYFLIGVWGHERRVPAAFKFFLFTQGGGLLMFASILGLYFLHGHSTGVYSFEYRQLLQGVAPSSFTFLLMLGFFLGFAVKLPVVGLHTWLPDAHTEAPTAGSVVLAGLLLKTGAYGMLRFALPLFPRASAELAHAALILGTIGILYGAFLAFAQIDAKRLVAYTSISHLGFALLGIYAGNRLALQGAIIVLLAHGLSTGGLFIIVGALQERLHTRRMDELGGLWSSMPRMGGVALFLAVASLGLPGLANFVGEFLVLTGTFAVNPPLAAVAAVGFVLSSIYSLWLIYRVFQGPQRQTRPTADLGRRELAIFACLIAVIVWLGIYPQPVLNAARPTVDSLTSSVTYVMRGEGVRLPGTANLGPQTRKIAFGNPRCLRHGE
jgi:NADH-quinone oxidoreductase subunit M